MAEGSLADADHAESVPGGYYSYTVAGGGCVDVCVVSV